MRAENVYNSLPAERWSYFLRNAEQLSQTEIRRLFPDEEIVEAAGLLEMISQTPEQRLRYNARLKFQRDEEARVLKAREDGLREGVVVGRIAIYLVACVTFVNTCLSDILVRPSMRATVLQLNELSRRFPSLRSLRTHESDASLRRDERAFDEFISALQRGVMPEKFNDQPYEGWLDRCSMEMLSLSEFLSSSQAPLDPDPSRQGEITYNELFSRESLTVFDWNNMIDVHLFRGWLSLHTGEYERAAEDIAVAWQVNDIALRSVYVGGLLSLARRRQDAIFTLWKQLMRVRGAEEGKPELVTDVVQHGKRFVVDFSRLNVSDSDASDTVKANALRRYDRILNLVSDDDENICKIYEEEMQKLFANSDVEDDPGLMRISHILANRREINLKRFMIALTYQVAAVHSLDEAKHQANNFCNSGAAVKARFSATVEALNESGNTYFLVTGSFPPMPFDSDFVDDHSHQIVKESLEILRKR